MIDIRIVCTLEAVKLAEQLARLLTAEGHGVRIAYGRASLEQLADARAGREAVLLIWSAHAQVTQYMAAWARGADAARLIEIAYHGEAAPGARRAAPIDFSAWRGERGGRAWNALNERLRAVARAIEPPRPQPRRAAMALGLVSVAAVAGAVAVRVNDVFEPPAAEDAHEPQFVMDYDPGDGVGGALHAIEPASIGDEDPLHAGPFPALRPLDPLAPTPLGAPIRYDAPELREATFLERLSAFNPLDGQSED